MGAVTLLEVAVVVDSLISVGEPCFLEQLSRSYYSGTGGLTFLSSLGDLPKLLILLSVG